MADRTVLSLPPLGWKGAPKKFTGKSNEVQDWTEAMDSILRHCNVDDAGQQVQASLRYVSHAVKMVLKELEAVKTPNWETLKKDIARLYDAERTESRYLEKDLDALVSKNARHKMKSLSKYRKYERRFMRVAGFLYRSSRISADQRNRYFWLGFHPSHRSIMELYIMKDLPSHDLANPFPKTNIESAAEKLFKRDRFDAERSRHAGHSSDSDTESNDETDSGSETKVSSDSEEDKSVAAIKKKLEKLKKERTKKKKERESDRTKSKLLLELERELALMTKEEEEDGRLRASEILQRAEASRHATERRRQEVQYVPEQRARFDSITPSPVPMDVDDEEIDLVNRLSQMNISTPDYAVTFHRAAIRYPRIAETFEKPRPISHQSLSQSSQPRPAVVNNYPPAQSYGRPYSNFGNSYGGATGNCYGCGRPGHRAESCPDLEEFHKKQIIKRGELGRVVWASGQTIYRQGNETIAEAVKRTQASSTPTPAVATANIVRVAVGSAPTSQVHVVKTATALPTQRVPEVVITRSRKRRDEPMLVDIEPTPFDVNDSDAYIEDDEDTIIIPMPTTERRKRTLAQTPLQRSLNGDHVIQQVLDTEISLPMRTVIGLSESLSKGIQDLLKKSTDPSQTIEQILAPSSNIPPTRPPTPAENGRQNHAQVFETTIAPSRATITQAPLLTLNVETSGGVLKAINDCGSEVNLASRRVYDQFFESTARPNSDAHVARSNDWK